MSKIQPTKWESQAKQTRRTQEEKEAIFAKYQERSIKGDSITQITQDLAEKYHVTPRTISTWLKQVSDKQLQKKRLSQSMRDHYAQIKENIIKPWISQIKYPMLLPYESGALRGRTSFAGFTWRINPQTANVTFTFVDGEEKYIVLRRHLRPPVVDNRFWKKVDELKDLMMQSLNSKGEEAFSLQQEAKETSLTIAQNLENALLSTRFPGKCPYCPK